MKILALAFVLLSPITSFAQDDDDMPIIEYPNMIAFPEGTTLKFTYESFDDGNGIYTVCRHEYWKNSPFDWDVYCTLGKNADGKDIVKKYVAHLALRGYTHPTPPRITYEMLYWVDGNGASTLVDLQDNTPVMKWQSSQSLTGDSAALRVVIQLPTQELVLPKQ